MPKFLACNNEEYGSTKMHYCSTKKDRQHLPDPHGPLSLKVLSSGISTNLCASKLLDKTSTDTRMESAV